MRVSSPFGWLVREPPNLDGLFGIKIAALFPVIGTFKRSQIREGVAFTGP
jgi:hypothetical protein